MKWGFLLVLAGCFRGVAAQSDDHPVSKVIKLLESLSAKVEQEKKAEDVTYTKFEYWCTNSIKTMTKAIADGKSTIESLEDKIASLEEEEQVLTDQIKELGDQLLELDAASKKAYHQRRITANLFKEADADYDSTIQAIKDALKAMENAYKATEPALIQSSLKLMSAATKAKLLQALTLGASAAAATDKERTQITNLLQALTVPSATAIDGKAVAGGGQQNMAKAERPADFKAEGDYDEHIDKYDFKSHTVIELLKGLQTKFEDEKLAAVKAETNSQNAYTLAKQERDEVIKQSKALKKTKEGELVDVQADLSTAKGDLKSEQDDLAADEATLTSTEKTCELKKQEYNERQTTRAGEQEAMAQAIKILAEVAGVRTEAPSNPVPPPSPVGTQGAPAASLLEVSANPKARAVELLRKSAQETHSKALERLAQEISAHLTGPFDEVNNMIEKMIFRLMQEQKDEDDHKNWCDLELNKTDTSISDKADKIKELKSKIATAVARMTELTKEIEGDNERIAIISKHMADSEEIRAAGKEENRLAIKDSQEAQNAIASAVAVLDQFYKESGMIEKKSYEFVQAPEVLDAPPNTWTKSYTGITDPAAQPTGILSVLKSVAADFSRMEADTNAQEESDQHYFEEDMKNSKIEKARHMKEVEMKTEEKKRLVAKKQALEAQLKHTSDEKEATEQYLKDLQHACVDGDSTYEDRVAARAKEIAALKQAQIILRDAFKEKSSFLQRRVRF